MKEGDKVKIVSGPFQGGYGWIEKLCDNVEPPFVMLNGEDGKLRYTHVLLSDIELDAWE